MNLNLIIILFFIIFFLIYYKNKEGFDDWKMYQEKPYGNIHTGYSPLTYYERNRYRKPYNYPVCHMKDYPVRHCAYFD